jgi:hypothetical protein
MTQADIVITFNLLYDKNRRTPSPKKIDGDCQKLEVPLIVKDKQGKVLSQIMPDLENDEYSSKVLIKILE